MQKDVEALVGPHGWELTHAPGNSASSNLGRHCLSDWLQTAPPTSRVWDVISFQFGLHDIAYDVERISAEQYRVLLQGITDELVAVQKASGTKLLWVRTTPVPTVPTYGLTCNDTSKCLNPPRFDADVVLYNTVADEIIAEANANGADIPTLDLYTFVLKHCGGTGYSHCDGFQLPQNVHFTAAGWTALGQEMADGLLKLTEGREQAWI